MKFNNKKWHTKGMKRDLNGEKYYNMCVFIFLQFDLTMLHLNYFLNSHNKEKGYEERKFIVCHINHDEMILT